MKAGQNNNSQAAGVVSEPVKVRLDFLDGLRGFLALLVVVGHFNHYLGLKEGIWNETNLLALGVRVPMFFALSGFVLYLSSAARDRIELKTPLKDFVWRRVLRLVPAYYVAMLFAYLLPRVLVWTHLAKPDLLHARDTESLLWHLTFLHSWHPAYDIQWGVNGPTWMMGYEWQLSLMVPLFLWAIRGIGWIPVIAIAFFLGTPWGAVINHGFFYASFTLAFLLGMAGVRVVKRPDILEKLGGAQKVARFTGLVVLISVLALVPVKKLTGNQYLAECLAGLITAGLCVYMTLVPQSWVTRFFSIAPLRKVGIVAYSLFLLHYPILLIASLGVGKFQLDGWAKFGAYLLTVPIIAIATILSYRWFEAPFIEALREAKKKAIAETEPKEVAPSTAGG